MTKIGKSVGYITQIDYFGGLMLIVFTFLKEKFIQNSIFSVNKGVGESF